MGVLFNLLRVLQAELSKEFTGAGLCFIME
jgi:hypothetical protein